MQRIVEPKFGLNQRASKTTDGISQYAAPKSNISSYLVEQIHEALDIVTVLEDEYGLVFHEDGKGWWKTSCPFPDHRDSSPSFGANSELGVFNCFGCSRHGDIITFVRQVEGFSFYESVEKLRVMAGIDISDDDHNNAEIAMALRGMKALANEYLTLQANTNLPGGMSLPQYMRSLAVRLKSYEAKTEYDPKELEWVDSIYRTVDDLAAKDDEKGLNKFWTQLSSLITEKLSVYSKQKNHEKTTA